MVDVRLVGHEQRPLVTRTPQHHANHIQTRHHQHAERHQHRTRLHREQHIRLIHTVLDDKEAQNIPQRQAAGIPHENLPSQIRTAEHVVRKERNNHPHRHESQHGIAPHVEMHEQHPEHQQRHHTQPRCQSVDTVNQVDGIGDEHHQQHGQRNTYLCRNQVNAKETIEIVDIQARQRKHRRRDNLHQELLPVAHPNQVVGNAHDIQQGQPSRQEKKLAHQVRCRCIRRSVARHQPHGRKHAQGKKNYREKGHSPEARYRTFVYFPFIRHVKQAFAQ